MGQPDRSGESLPLTTVVGDSVIPGTLGKFLANNTSFQCGDAMSKVKGRHALTWGGTIYRIWVNANTTAKPTMQFDSPQEFVVITTLSRSEKQNGSEIYYSSRPSRSLP